MDHEQRNLARNASWYLDVLPMRLPIWASPYDFARTGVVPNEWAYLKPSLNVGLALLRLAHGVIPAVKDVLALKRALNRVPLHVAIHNILAPRLDPPVSQPSRHGDWPCPVCGTPITEDPEHWGAFGRRSCPVRAYLTREEAMSDLATLGVSQAVADGVVPRKEPFVVNVMNVVLESDDSLHTHTS